MMATYLIKVILLTGSLWLFYQLALSNEPSFKFNRVFLILACMLPLIIPHVEWWTPSQTVWLPLEALSPNEVKSTPSVDLTTHESTLNGIWQNWFYIFAAAISGIFILLFFRHLYLAWRQIMRGEIIQHKSYQVVLINGDYAPQSFFHFLLVGKSTYQSDQWDTVILEHELAHIKQGHSWDILLIELMAAIFWFNPFLYLLRRAIRLNHEFLADQVVIQQLPSHTHYQQLLLKHISQTNGLSLASSFNFKMIKKRFLMMTRRKTTFKTTAKQMLALPILLGLCLLFARPVQGQEVQEVKKEKSVMLKQKPKEQKERLISRKPVIKSGPGLSATEMQEYATILKKYGLEMDGKKMAKGAFDTADLASVKDLYLKMTTEQRKQQPLKGWMRPPILRSTPSRQQLEEWSQKSYFHVYIDGKRVENAVLNNYKNYQFTRHEVNLETTTTNTGKEKRYWKVELMLPDYYLQQIEKAEQNGQKAELTFLIPVKES